MCTSSIGSNLFFYFFIFFFFFFQAEDGIRDAQESRGLGDVYKRQVGEIGIHKYVVCVFLFALRRPHFGAIKPRVTSLHSPFLYPQPLFSLFLYPLSLPSFPTIGWGCCVVTICRFKRRFLGNSRVLTAVSYTHLTLPTKRIV
eukprot:TRINITY_DN2774_c0_g1_i19.p1 TRINITY_DN2774_c0_g1~~TRINITY_DN2774_c0_g1_i19.p1  ORF type:complete len:143 (+),score=26.17 TRINITY_DN2774_c0_g1_i19:76-504(+)